VKRTITAPYAKPAKKASSRKKYEAMSDSSNAGCQANIYYANAASLISIMLWNFCEYCGINGLHQKGDIAACEELLSLPLEYL